MVAGDSKSVISQVYEVALKMKLPIKFEVLKEDGLPHMKTYITKCTVGTYNATGDGNGKKVLLLFLKLHYSGGDNNVVIAPLLLDIL